MADIELVIKISDELYDNIRFIKRLAPVRCREVGHAILDGTPLPKGHGRLADMDEAIKCIEEANGEDAIWAISLIDWACSKRTIIEADKGESEEV